MTGVIHVPLGATTLHSHGAFRGIDPNSSHWQKVNHQPLITYTQPGAIVPSASNGDGQTILTGKIDRCPHIRHVRATNNRGRTTVDHFVVDLPSNFKLA